MGISIRAYARHRGVTDTAVHKAIRAGRSNRRDWYLVNHAMRVTPCRPWPESAQRWRRTADF